MKTVFKLIIVLLPTLIFAQSKEKSNIKIDYKTGVAVNFGIGNSMIEIGNYTFNGNSNITSIQGDFIFKNGITLTPGIGFVKISYQALIEDSYSSNEISIIQSPLKIGYGFTLNNKEKSKIRLLPRIGFYYNNFIKLKSQTENGNILTNNALGGNFGFTTDIGLSIKISKALYTEINFTRSSDFNSVKYSNNQSLKIKDDKTIKVSFGFLF